MGWIAGLLFGRYRRDKRGGASTIAMLIGLLSCIGSCGMALFVAPATFVEGRGISQLPRPDGAALGRLQPGARILIGYRLPASADGMAGFGLSKTESRAPDARGTPAPDWRRTSVEPAELRGALIDGMPLSVRTSASLRLHDATTRDAPASAVVRHRGYAPGTILAVHGEWTGEALNAIAVYPGTPDAFVEYMTVSSPLASLGMALICALMGIGLIGAGLVARLFRR